MNPVKPPRVLFSVTFVILFVFATSTYLYTKTNLPPSVTVDTHAQPTIGYPKAKVHVVVFEEPKCVNCQSFNNDIFPIIKKEYIDTNKIRYTVIPVSFMPGSMPAAVAALCVFNQDPNYPNDELFFKYWDMMYHREKSIESDWVNQKKLNEFAKATSPAIDTNQLQNCVTMETYRIQVEKNTSYGAQLMGGTISTPNVYVNGIMVQELSIEEIRDLIDLVLKHEGVEK